MQMRIEARGVGIGIPKMTGTISTLMSGDIILRDINGNETWLSIKKNFSANIREGTLAFAAIDTHWLIVDPVKDNWLYNPWLLAKDHIAEIEVDAGSLSTKKADVHIKIFHANKIKHQTDLYNVAAEGTQMATLIVRGDIYVHQKNKVRRFKIKGAY